MYVFDYGAPVGFNLAVANPERITAIVSQNGNAYEEGLGAGPWAPLRAYWRQPSNATASDPSTAMYQSIESGSWRNCMTAALIARTSDALAPIERVSPAPVAGPIVRTMLTAANVTKRALRMNGHFEDC